MIYLTLFFFDGWEVMKKFHPLMLKELTFFFFKLTNLGSESLTF